MQARCGVSRSLSVDWLRGCVLWLLILSQVGLLPCVGRQWAIVWNQAEATESESSEVPLEEELVEVAAIPSTRTGRLAVLSEFVAPSPLTPQVRGAAENNRTGNCVGARCRRNGFGGPLRC